MSFELAYRRLTGELRPVPGVTCDVIGCGMPAICLVGCGQGHPSCEGHARMADYIEPITFPTGLRVRDTRPGSDTVWTVRSFDYDSEFYTVEGLVGGAWPAVRCFTQEELIPV